MNNPDGFDSNNLSDRSSSIISNTLEPTADDNENLQFSVRFSSALDLYKIRDGNEVRYLGSIISGSQSVIQEVDTALKCSYLSLNSPGIQETNYWTVEWIIDVYDSPHSINQVNIRCKANRSECNIRDVLLLANKHRGKFLSKIRIKKDRSRVKFAFWRPEKVTVIAKMFPGSQLSAQLSDDRAAGESPFEITCFLGDSYDPEAAGYGIEQNETLEVVGRTIQPSLEDYGRKMFKFRYSPALDVYQIGDNRKEHGWLAYVYQHQNVFRTANHLQGTVYLTRTNNATEPTESSIEWKFAINNSYHFCRIDILFRCSTLFTGRVDVTVEEGDMSHVIQTDGSTNEIELSPFIRELVISAHLSGDAGKWGHARLFCQSVASKSEFPFEVCLYMDKNYDHESHEDSDFSPESDGDSSYFAQSDEEVTSEFQPEIETIIPGEVMKPSPDDYARKVFLLRYSAAADVYIIGENDTVHGWSKCAHQHRGIFRKVEHDRRMVCLSREHNEFDPGEGLISWKFQTTGSYCFHKMDVKFRCAVFETGKVYVTVDSGDILHVVETNGNVNTFELGYLVKVKEVVISAYLSGGIGGRGWQHAQLFRQSLDAESQYPFEVCLFIEE